MRMGGGYQAWTHAIHHLLVGLEGGLGVHGNRVVRRRGIVLRGKDRGNVNYIDKVLYCNKFLFIVVSSISFGNKTPCYV